MISLLVFIPIAGGTLPRGFNFYANFSTQTLSLQEFTHPPVFVTNVETNVLNGSLWSVRTEFWCYIGLMFLGASTLIRRRAFLLIAIAAAMYWHLLEVQGQGHSIRNRELLQQAFGNLFDWSHVLPCFLAGVIFHQFGGPTLIRRNYLIAAGLLLTVSDFIPNALVFTIPTCGTYLLMGLASSPALQSVHLGRYGDFSYGTYLYAYPVQQLIVWFLGTSISPITLFLLAAPISLGFGVSSWMLVERPFLSRGAVLRHTGSIPTRHNRASLPTKISAERLLASVLSDQGSTKP